MRPSAASQCDCEVTEICANWMRRVKRYSRRAFSKKTDVVSRGACDRSRGSAVRQVPAAAVR